MSEAVNLTTLQINIEDNASKAVSPLNNLAAALEKLKSASIAARGLESVATQLERIAKLSGIRCVCGKPDTVRSAAGS